jgi:hypothetical protein
MILNVNVHMDSAGNDAKLRWNILNEFEYNEWMGRMIFVSQVRAWMVDNVWTHFLTGIVFAKMDGMEHFVSRKSMNVHRIRAKMEEHAGIRKMASPVIVPPAIMDMNANIWWTIVPLGHAGTMEHATIGGQPMNANAI